MKKLSYSTGLALALSLAAFATSGAQAQQQAHRQEQGEARRGPGGRGGEGQLLKGINLSDAQKAQVKSLREEQRKEVEAKRAEREKNGGQRGQVARTQRDTAGMGARRAEFGKRREQEVARLRNILTNDQRAQFDKNVAEMKQRFAERQKQGGAGRPEGARHGDR